MNRTLRIATYNIHKGLSSFNARLVLDEQRELIRYLHADIVFLQEVRGAHSRHSSLFTGGQYEFLADSIWSDFAYGQNAVRSDGHHGNAILSKYPIASWENEISPPTPQSSAACCIARLPFRAGIKTCIASACISVCLRAGVINNWHRYGHASIKWCPPKPP